MPLQDGEIARRENGQLFIRASGARVRWNLNDLTSSDGHQIRAAFEATVRPLPQATEQRMLEEALLARKPTATAADVSVHFAAPLEAAARRQVNACDIESLLADSGRAVLLGKLADAAKAVAFASGLELLPPMDLDLDSPSLRAAQEESRRSASQSQRLTRAAQLFKQFQELRAAAPDVPPEKILQQLGGGPAEQAEILRCLLLSSAQESARRPLWAVAGPHLIKIEWETSAAGPAPRMELFTPPDTFGPFRSVQRATLNDRPMLLLGARSGLLAIDPASPQEATAYPYPQTASALGFNAIVATGNKLWATHGEAGIVSWDWPASAQPGASVAGNGTPWSPRNLLVVEGDRLVFSSENRLFDLNAEGVMREADAPGASPIIAIIPESNATLLVIHEEGDLCRRERAGLRLISRVRRTGRLTAAGSIPWLGTTRILLATEAGPVLCVGMEDELIGQYISNHTGLRQTAAAADRVAAVSADRQRILLWPSWDGRGPPVELHVAAAAKHRVADIEC